ncbi:hypothetical protein GRS48_02335 [Halorubrum sp. JWXQ-INN 858]|uniref:hypothetical protein n=1 Tax=Halorubrum sp. JWXQ-INN 858 TaxID=2690782 RepID=UPI00135CEE53|nr:hypothetical protein [Halorubrum sp. JWXQ-INN 858]MWV63666.1 hypothetical protein [Halorubrum sp. JWXQ-INN 858]
MTIADRFGADIDVRGPDPDSEGTFLVTPVDGVDHEAFVTALLGVIGGHDRLLAHHRSGFALVRIPFDRSRRLRRLPWIATVGGVSFDPERFAAVVGGNPPT